MTKIEDIKELYKNLVIIMEDAKLSISKIVELELNNQKFRMAKQSLELIANCKKDPALWLIDDAIDEAKNCLEAIE